MTGSLRTLHVIDGLGAGGAERSLAELLPAIREHDVLPAVAIAHHRDVGVHAQVVDAGIPVHRTPARLMARARAVRALARDADVALVHSTLASSNAAARLAAVGGPPLLTSLVNTPFAEGRIAAGAAAPWKLEVLRRVERLTARPTTTHFHAITRAVADHAIEALGIPESAITVIPRGRDRRRLGTASSKRRSRVRHRLGLGDDEQVIISVGRQEPQKGQRHLLEALSVLRLDGMRPTTLVVGRQGSATNDLRRRTDELDLGDQVRFLGHRDDVPDLLVASDLFVFPSLYEGLGGAVLEAMALRTPIVAADSPAVREVLDDGRAGRLVPIADPPALAAAMAEALADPDRLLRMVDHGAGRFEETYRHDVVVAAMANLFHRVADMQ